MRDNPFVARADVVADLDAMCEAARRGRGRLVLITGEPGIGKSRLAEEATQRAEGFRVVWTWCTPTGVGGALRPWARVVRKLAGADAGAARAVQQSSSLTELVAQDRGFEEPATIRQPRGGGFRSISPICSPLRRHRSRCWW